MKKIKNLIAIFLLLLFLPSSPSLAICEYNEHNEYNKEKISPTLICFKALNENGFSPYFAQKSKNIDVSVRFKNGITKLSIPFDEIYELTKDENVIWIEERAKPFIRSTLNVSAVETNAKKVWDMEINGSALTGKNIKIVDVDTGVDIFHPSLWKADGGEYSWRDLNGNNEFDSGIDGVDINNNGFIDANEKLKFIDGVIYGPGGMENNDGIYQPSLDWLYNDANNDSIRNYGVASGFNENSPTYGEQLFILKDKNENGKMDISDTLLALKTSKVYKTYSVGNVERRRGVDLINNKGDKYSHGTPVSGILAGGEQNYEKFTGMAPGSELLVSSNYPEDTIDWAIDNNADIIIYEFGSWLFEYLDGSSNLEYKIDDAAKKGIIQVTASGNLAGSKKHFQLFLKGSESIGFNVPPISIGWVVMTILWYNSSLQFKITSPAGSSAILPGDANFLNLPDGHSIYSYISKSLRETMRMDIAINRTPIAQGSWLLEISGGANIEINGYIGDDKSVWSGGSTFTDFTNDVHTMTLPSTADSAIVVGSYSTRDYLTSIGELSFFSGQGPRIDGKKTIDITAPGDYDIITSASKDAGYLHGSYVWFGGTSAALPHVGGIIALLLQAKKMNQTQVCEAIRNTARKDIFTGKVPNDRWGYGKIDAYSAIKFILEKPKAEVQTQHYWWSGNISIEWSAYDSYELKTISLNSSYSKDKIVWSQSEEIEKKYIKGKKANGTFEFKPKNEGYYEFFCTVTNYFFNENETNKIECGVDFFYPDAIINISKYWHNTTPIRIDMNAWDSGSGIINTKLMCRYSINNHTWDDWYVYDEQRFSSWSFEGKDGYYQFFIYLKDISGKERNIRVDGEVGIDTKKPIANAGNDINVKQGSEFEISALGSYDNIGIANYTWRFKDNKTIYGPIQRLVFNEIGKEEVELEVFDFAGNSDKDLIYVNVSDGLKPIANAGDNATISFGNYLYLDASLSWDNIGIVGYTWTFTDKENIVLFGKNVSYKFETIGTHIVILNVSDSNGNFGLDRIVINVIDDEKPIAKAGEDREVLVNEVVYFDSSGSKDNFGIADYKWFLDGKIFRGKNISYRFSEEGTYVVLLRVEDFFGNWDEDNITINVSFPEIPPEVGIYEPKENETISGTVKIRGFAYDDRNIVSIEIKIDNGTWNQVVGYESWYYYLDTTVMQNGKYKIHVRAYDGSIYSYYEMNFSVKNEKIKEVENTIDYSWLIILLPIGIAIAF
ncbi:MAG: PKD domain-containing protein, partial [Candidatus Thermoplasmatota archaeon]